MADMFSYALIVFFCSFIYGLSAVLCKYGLQSNIRLRSYSVKQIIFFLIRNKVWALGVAISFAANVIIVEMQSIIDISIVYPILNFSYVFTLIIGYFFLKEVLDKSQLIGLLIVVIGTSIIILIEDSSTGSATNARNLFNLSLVSLIVIFSVIYIVYKNNIENYEILYAVCTGICFSNVETYIRATTNMVNTKLGYFTVLSLDSLVYFVSLGPFFMLLFFTCVGWICMQVAYSHGNVSITVPIFAALQSILTMMSGFYVYNEAVTVEKTIGILTIVTGVSLIVLSSIRAREVTTV